MHFSRVISCKEDKKQLDIFVIKITLDYLINEHDGTGDQGGKFLKVLKRAGWNKRAEGAKKFTSINEQGGNQSCLNIQKKKMNNHSRK